MSIADKITSIAGHLEDDYTALEQLGVSVEDRNIENIKDMANQIYAKFPKTDYAEGTEITLSNTLKGKLDYDNGVVGYGDTSQNSYSGKNLYPSGTSTQTIAGVTFTPQEDGSLKLNGTSTYSNYYVAGGESNYVQVENLSNIAETVTLSVSGIHQEGIQVYVVGSTLGAKGLAVNGSISFTTILNDTYRIFVRVMAETNANSTLKIQLEKGSSATSFEKYVGGTASPNPSYPQEIEVVRGKNRLPLNEADFTTTFYGQNIEIKDQTIKISGSATEVYSIMVGKNGLVTPTNTNRITFKVNSGTYKYTQFTSGTSYSGINVRLKDENTNTLYTTESTITLTETHTFSINIFVADTGSKNAEIKIQLEKGSQATSYLPYNTIEVVERGKNYCGFNSVSSTGRGVDYIIDKSEITLNGTTNGGGYIYTSTTNFITIPKGTYKLSGYILGGSYNYVGDIEIALKKASDNTKVLTLYKTHYDNQATITLTEDTDLYYGIYTNGSNNVLNNFKIGIQIEAGSSATTYEPYQTPQTYQLSLGEYEFAKIGNYVDTIEYDVENDKVYKNKAINKKIIDGTEGWQDSGMTSVAYTNIITDYATSNNIPYCTHFKGENNCNGAGGMQDYGDNSIAFMQVSGSITPRLYIKKIGMTTTQLRALLAEIKPPLYYALETEVKEEITGTLKDQIKDIYNLMSYTGTTIIEIDGQLPLIIKVRALKGN